MASSGSDCPPAPRDCSEPRQVNGQAVMLRRGHDGQLEVLLQRRADSMQVMPGYLGTVGGMRDWTDSDSRHTTIREVREETGLLLEGITLGPVKFAQGAKCDWYVMMLEHPQFEQQATSRDECGDIEKALPWLPETATPAECFGHAWIPVADIGQINERQPLMGGLVNRVREAVQHLQTFDAQCAPNKDVGAGRGWPSGKGKDSSGKFSGRGKGYKGEPSTGEELQRPARLLATRRPAIPLPSQLQRPEALPALASTGEEVAFQFELGTPWRLLGTLNESFRWQMQDRNAVQWNDKQEIREILRRYADEHGIPLTGDSAVRLALHRRNFWVSYAGGISSVDNA